MTVKKILKFENALDDLITEIITEEDFEEFEKHYEDYTIISIIKEAVKELKGEKE